MSTTLTVSSDVSLTYNSGSPVTVTIASGTIATALVSVYSPSFAQAAQVALVEYALAVIQEDNSLTNASSRKNYARLALSNPTLYASNALAALACDGVTSYASSDQDLLNRVASVWDQLCYGL
jgi:hypothetical protein